MATRPLVTIQSPTKDQAKQKPIALPAVFVAPIRNDIVQHVHTMMNKNHRQPYGVKYMAGMKYAAESWGTGRAVARIPRISGGGTNRSGQGAFGNMCRGGRMFAPTKTWRRWHRKISKGQRRFATCSALAASAVPALVMARGHKIDTIPEVPLVVADVEIDGITKTKEAIKLLSALHAYDDVERVKASRKIRPGSGKTRNRRHVQGKGPLIIHNKDRDNNSVFPAFRNIPGVEICHVARLNLLQLAPGGHLGRFIIWTQGAFSQLDKVFGTYKTDSAQKSGFRPPKSMLTNADITHIMKSQSVKAVLRPVHHQHKHNPQKKNPLKNLGAMVKLNPYALTQKRRAILASQKQKGKRAKAVKNSRAGPKFNAIIKTPSVAPARTELEGDPLKNL
jgi:large subunit ribosomal protein L4e